MKRRQRRARSNTRVRVRGEQKRADVRSAKQAVLRIRRSGKVVAGGWLRMLLLAVDRLRWLNLEERSTKKGGTEVLQGRGELWPPARPAANDGRCFSGRWCAAVGAAQPSSGTFVTSGAPAALEVRCRAAVGAARALHCCCWQFPVFLFSGRSGWGRPLHMRASLVAARLTRPGAQSGLAAAFTGLVEGEVVHYFIFIPCTSSSNCATLHVDIDGLL